MGIVSQTGTKVVHLALLRDELFHPVREDNINSEGIVKSLAAVATEALLDELHNTNKASYKYLSSSGSPFSYEHCPENIKKDMIGKMDTNDLAESSFAGVTSQIQKYSRINIAGAAAISDMQRNKYFSYKGNGTGKVGVFHQFSEGIRSCLVRVGVEDAPITRRTNNSLLEKQRKARHEKAELARMKIYERATEDYIDAVYYHRMYQSEACWKTVREVTNGLKHLKTKKDKYEALKENIQIRVIGFGWKQFKQAWSKDGNPYTIEFLANALKNIIRKSSKMDIPKAPAIEIPKRKNLPVLGEQSKIVKKLDKKFIKDEKKFRKDALGLIKEREESGFGSIYSEMQSRVVPTIDDSFIGKKIDVLFKFDILDGNENEQGLRWCQGVVKKIISTGRSQKPKVEVLWDTIPEELNHGQQTTIQILPESKWNKNVEGAWRMNIDIIDEDGDNESNQ